MAIVDSALKFYHGAIELYDTMHLIRRLEGMVANLERRNDETAERGRASMHRGILSILTARGMTCSDETRNKLEECVDMDKLDQWHDRALRATSEADVFSG